jgi:hypothetical protein
MWQTRLDSPMKFLISWAGASFVILSLVSGKQAYYLMPMIPAFALILARLATAIDRPILKTDLYPVIAGTIVMGALPLIANHVPPLSETRLNGLISDWYSIPMMACGAVLIPFSSKRTESAVFAVGTNAVLFFVLVILAVRPTMWQGFDFRPLATAAASHNCDVAWYGGYHGQLNYLGQIRHVHEASNREDLSRWLSQHPDGLLIMRLSSANGQMLRVAGVAHSATPASLKTPLTSPQAEKISQILRAEPIFKGHEWEPTVTELYWVRTGLTSAAYVFVEFEKQPALR